MTGRIGLYVALSGALGCVLADAAGCGSSDDPVAEGSNHGQGGASAAGGDASAGTGTGGSGASEAGGGTGAGTFIDTGTGSDQLTADTACAGQSEQAEVIPLAMYILLDSTGSMLEQGKWNTAVSAINTFVADPKSAGIKVALQNWSGWGPCDGTVYNTPAVPMDVLPNHVAQIGSWLAGIVPDGMTPTQGALLGLVNFCSTYAAQNPKEKVIGLLVTDGLPTACDTNPSTLTGIAASGFNAVPSIQVFTMGMQGSDLALLTQIAIAGGTQQAYDATGGPQAFIDALEAIRGTALSCEFELPKADGGSVDPEKVNVEFTPSEGGKQTVYKVDDEAACVPWGWYYDDPVAPTKIVLCPQTCDEVQKDTAGRIDLIVGCLSIPPV